MVNGTIITNILREGDLLMFSEFLMAKMMETNQGRLCISTQNPLKLKCDNTITNLEKLFEIMYEVFETQYDMEKLEIM